MFTTEDDVPLADVLKKLFELEKGKASLDPKAEEKKDEKKEIEVKPAEDKPSGGLYTNDGIVFGKDSRF